MQNFNKLPWFWWQTTASAEDLDNCFDIDFEDNPADPLYREINAVEPVFFQNMNDKNNEEEGWEDEEDEDVIDPRTKKKVKNLTIDHSISQSNNSKEYHLNKFPLRSTLSKEEHITYLRAIKTPRNELSIQNAKALDEIIKKCNKECTEFNKYVEYISTDIMSNQFDDRSKVLINLYNLYLTTLSKKLLKCDEIIRNYSIKTIPIINYFYDLNKYMKPIEYKYLIYDNQQILKTVGKLNYVNDHSNFLKMKGLINMYEYEIDEIAKSFINDNIIDNDNLKLLAIENNVNVIIPEDTLQFLLCAKEYEQFEIPFTIENHNNLRIIFKETLPLTSIHSRNNNLIYEQLFELMSNLNSESINDEIFAVNLKQNYKLIDFIEFIKKNSSKTNQFIEYDNKMMYPKNNFDLIRWSLKKSNEKHFKILTKRKIHAIKHNDSENTKNLVNYSFKLEHKKEYGAECMTKNELIQEWIRQFLLPESYTERVRIDVESLKSIMHQNLSLNNIEMELFSLYNIKPIQLLYGLYSTLDILDNFPIGNYILKYNHTENNKFHIYKEEIEKKSSNENINFSSIHEFIAVNGLRIFKENSYLPIDKNVITPLHYHNNIIPCCFPYWNGQDKPTTFEMLNKGFDDDGDEDDNYKAKNVIKKPKKNVIKKLKKNVIKKPKKNVIKKLKKNVIKKPKKKYEDRKKQSLEFRKKLRMRNKKRKRREKLKKLKEEEFKAEDEFDKIDNMF